MNLNSWRFDSREIYLFIAIPVVLNCLLLGLYFSGIHSLQQIVSPNNGILTRESGLLEQLQNIYLLSIFSMFTYCAIKRKELIEKAFFSLLSFAFLVMFLEEIDYGLNLYEFFTDKELELQTRNWHNESTKGGKQNVHYFKNIIDLLSFFWFILLPLFAAKIKIPFIKCLMPSRIFIIAFIFTIIYSRIAHTLNDYDFGIIDGVPGSLSKNISEFREHNNYYLYLLYAFQIIKTNLAFKIKS